jgi:uncharacterized protein YkwD
MNFSTPGFPDASVRLKRILNFSIRSAFVACACLSAWGNAQGQNMMPRPVARLISEPANSAPLSRARRVTAEEKSPTADAASEIERRAFEQTNIARVTNGLAPLVWDVELCRMARAHSEKMATLGFFSHETPDGLQLKDRARENGVGHFRVIAENIAYNKGYDDPGGFAVERWLISSGHRANILYVGFQGSAIGSYVAADGSTYLTQLFIAR